LFPLPGVDLQLQHRLVVDLCPARPGADVRYVIALPAALPSTEEACYPDAQSISLHGYDSTAATQAKGEDQHTQPREQAKADYAPNLPSTLTLGW
jgi:hypothetical protein